MTRDEDRHLKTKVVGNVWTADSIGLRGSGRGVEEAVTPGLSEPWRGGKLRELKSFGAEVLHSPSPAL